jgi:hypothetical protein
MSCVINEDMVTAVNRAAQSGAALGDLKRLRLLSRQKHAVALRRVELAEENLRNYVPSAVLLAPDASEDVVEEEFEFLNDQLDELVVNEKNKYKEKMLYEYAVMSIENPELLPDCFRKSRSEVVPPPQIVPDQSRNPLMISSSRYSPMTFPGGPPPIPADNVIFSSIPDVPDVDEEPLPLTSGNENVGVQEQVGQNPLSNFASINEQGGFVIFGFQQMPDGMIVPVFTPKVQTLGSAPVPDRQIGNKVEVNISNRMRSSSHNSHFVDRQRSGEFLSGPPVNPPLHPADHRQSAQVPILNQNFSTFPTVQTAPEVQQVPQFIPLTPQARSDLQYGNGNSFYNHRQVTAMNVTNCKVRRLKSAHLLSNHFSYIERNLIEMGAGSVNISTNDFAPKPHLVEACLTLLLSSLEDVESVSQAANDISIKNGSDWCIMRRELLYRFSRKHILKQECEKNLKLLIWKSVSEVEDFLHKASLIYHAFCDTFKDVSTDIRRLVNCIVGKLPIEIAQQVISCIRQSQSGFLNLDSPWETLLPFESIDGPSVCDVVRHVARTHEETSQLERLNDSRKNRPYGTPQQRVDSVNLAARPGKTTSVRAAGEPLRPSPGWKSRPDGFDVGTWNGKFQKVIYVGGSLVKKETFDTVKTLFKCDEARLIPNSKGGDFAVIAYKESKKWDEVRPGLDDRYVCRDWVFKKSNF